MGRSPCCSKEGMNRGAWTSNEDRILTEYIGVHGQGRWRELPKKAGLQRCGKSCRLRWLNYLRPDIKRGNITRDEEELITKLHKLLGNRWSLIAGRLPGRTDNEIKNYWNTNLGKRVEGSSMLTSSPKNQNLSRKKRHMNESSSEAGKLPKVQSVQVVRTKAYRCTKVFLTSQTTKATSDLTKSKDTQLHRERDLESDNKSYRNCPSEGDNKPTFMKELDMGDCGLSDLLGSDFSQLIYFDKETRQFDAQDKNCSSNNLSISSDRTMLFDGGMLGNWRESDCTQHSECSSDLHSLASFLDPEEIWLHQ